MFCHINLNYLSSLLMNDSSPSTMLFFENIKSLLYVIVIEIK